MKKNVIRPLIQKLNPYVPGEQINLPGLIRLNTNEPPYAPAPEVLARIKDSVDARLRRYPNPTSDEVREKLASIHGCKKENILVGNGSDEVLELAVRVFVEPISPSINDNSASTVQYFDPSYSLYPVLADIAGALKNPVPLLSDFGIPITEQLKLEGKWDFNAALTFVTTPNAPTGRGYTTRELETLCANQNGIILLDVFDFGELMTILVLLLALATCMRCNVYWMFIIRLSKSISLFLNAHNSPILKPQQRLKAIPIFSGSGSSLTKSIIFWQSFFSNTYNLSFAFFFLGKTTFDNTSLHIPRL